MSAHLNAEITERKQAEEALRRERDFAESLIETAQAIVLVLDPEGRIVRFNPFMETLSGYRLDEVRGKDWFTTFLPECGRSKSREAFAKGLSSDSQTRGSISPIVTRDGQTRYVSWSDKTLKDTDGRTLGLLSIGHDVTDFQRAEAALRDREQRLEVVLASAGEGIFGIDEEGRFTFANRATLEMLGYRSEQELVGRDVHQLIHRKRANGGRHSREGFPFYLVRGQNKVIHLGEVTLWRADGSSFPCEYHSYPVMRDDTVVGTVVTFTDISERKNKEAQLLHAQKMEAVGRLTGGIAHDFNNLLTVILGNLELLQDGCLGDAAADVRELVDDALSAARDGAQLTHRLLAFSREQPLQMRKVDVNERLGSIRALLQRTLREDIEFRIDAQGDAPPVLVDPAQLENALLNLVLNARDAMPGGGTLRIASARRVVGPEECAGLPPGDYALISVSDSGVGMSPAVAARAMEPFFTTKERGKGSGLGLSMVYGFARRFGGMLLIESALGEGTTVSMLLPQAGADVESIEANDRDETARVLPGGSETILLVEDEPQVRKLAKRSLSELGYKVIEAANAAEAMQAFEAGAAVDLLFSDIVMPGAMNGAELARWVLQSGCGSKVLLTTGFGEEETGEPFPGNADFHLLRKPYTKKALAAAVRAVLDVEPVRCSPQ